MADEKLEALLAREDAEITWDGSAGHLEAMFDSAAVTFKGAEAETDERAYTERRQKFIDAIMRAAHGTPPLSGDAGDLPRREAPDSPEGGTGPASASITPRTPPLDEKPVAWGGERISDGEMLKAHCDEREARRFWAGAADVRVVPLYRAPLETGERIEGER